MKTHQLAKALRTLSSILEQGPNVDIEKFNSCIKNDLSNREIAVNLKTLYSLSKINKQDWIKLIDDFGFKIDIQQRDSSRNIIGKILNYIDANPSAIDTLKIKAKESSSSPSALNKALDILLKDL